VCIIHGHVICIESLRERKIINGSCVVGGIWPGDMKDEWRFFIYILKVNFFSCTRTWMFWKATMTWWSRDRTKKSTVHFVVLAWPWCVRIEKKKLVMKRFGCIDRRKKTTLKHLRVSVLEWRHTPGDCSIDRKGEGGVSGILQSSNEGN
jgi:hypothetical protein